MKKALLLGGVFALSFQFIDVTAAEGDKSQDLFRQIWSPYCKGVSLLECPSSQAQQLRDEIRHRLEAGEKSEDVLTELQSKYGDKLRMEPKAAGRELLAFVIPWIMLLIAAVGVLIFWILRKKKTKNQAAPPLQPAASSEYEEKVLNDLQKRME